MTLENVIRIRLMQTSKKCNVADKLSEKENIGHENTLVFRLGFDAFFIIF